MQAVGTFAKLITLDEVYEQYQVYTAGVRAVNRTLGRLKVSQHKAFSRFLETYKEKGYRIV